jgi:hypothetical protein
VLESESVLREPSLRPTLSAELGLAAPPAAATGGLLAAAAEGGGGGLGQSAAPPRQDGNGSQHEEARLSINDPGGSVGSGPKLRRSFQAMYEHNLEQSELQELVNRRERAMTGEGRHRSKIPQMIERMRVRAVKADLDMGVEIDLSQVMNEAPFCVEKGTPLTRCA